MAHEKLKAQYAIDKQYSDTPRELWEIRQSGDAIWASCAGSPSCHDHTIYRRKPDAPVWPDDKEDARKWRELEKKVNRYGGISAAIFNDIRHGNPKLIHGYTEEQWDTISDGKFLCEFSDGPFSGKRQGSPQPSFSIGTLSAVRNDTKQFCRSFGEGALPYSYCRPLRTKGVRQPWFGGECPVTGDVVIKMRNGQVRLSTGLMIQCWRHSGLDNDIIEFIEL